MLDTITITSAAHQADLSPSDIPRDFSIMDDIVLSIATNVIDKACALSQHNCRKAIRSGNVNNVTQMSVTCSSSSEHTQLNANSLHAHNNDSVTDMVHEECDDSSEISSICDDSSEVSTIDFVNAFDTLDVLDLDESIAGIKPSDSVESLASGHKLCRSIPGLVNTSGSATVDDDATRRCCIHVDPQLVASLNGTPSRMRTTDLRAVLKDRVVEEQSVVTFSNPRKKLRNEGLRGLIDSGASLNLNLDDRRRYLSVLSISPPDDHRRGFMQTSVASNQSMCRMVVEECDQSSKVSFSRSDFPSACYTSSALAAAARKKRKCKRSYKTRRVELPIPTV